MLWNNSKKNLEKTLKKAAKDKITQKSKNYTKQSDFLFGPCLESLKEIVRNRCLSIVIKIRAFSVFQGFVRVSRHGPNKKSDCLV